MLIDLTTRDRQPELMDDPALDEREHEAALRGLRRLNYFSRSAAIVWPEIRRAAADLPDRPLRVLDIATGSGDLPVALARLANSRGVALTITGCDVSSFAIQVASEAARVARVAGVEFLQADAIESEIGERFDVVMCSLFLHHLAEDTATRLLQRMRELTTRVVLVNDLRRTRRGYCLAWAASRLLTRSRIVHIDGPLSVRAAFTTAEVAALAERSGLAGADIATRWPQRFLLTWRTS